MTTIVVSVSGGKDSTACAIIALRRHGPESVRLVFADTGHEHPATLEYLRDTLPAALGVPIEAVRADFSAQIAKKRQYVAEKWPEKGVPAHIVDAALSVLHPTGVPFLDLCLWKGRFPSRMAQFCTQELKRRVLDQYLLPLLSAGPVESWQGVRRDESRNRRDAAKVEHAAEGWMIRRPIVAWSARQVVDFIRQAGVPLNPLYSQGCGRVGCMPCINASKAELGETARRWPEEIDRVAEWERLVGMASKRQRSTLLHHADGEGGDADHAYRHCNIRAMADWSRTSHGGRQYDLLSVLPPAECSSAYGLCE